MYRPFKGRIAKWAFPLLGHVFLAFDAQGIDAKEWQAFLRTTGAKWEPVKTFSFHPRSVRYEMEKSLGLPPTVEQGEGDLLGTKLATTGSCVWDDDQTDIRAFQGAIRWFAWRAGLRHVVTDDLAAQKRLFCEAWCSARRNNMGMPDPGPYSVTDVNCGRWTQVMVDRAQLQYPIEPVLVSNLGGVGVGGPVDKVRLGRILALTARTIGELAEEAEQIAGSGDSTLPDPAWETTTPGGVRVWRF